MKTILTIIVLFSGIVSGQIDTKKQARLDEIRYVSYNKSSLESAEAAITEYNWRANYEIQESWSKIENRLEAKGKNLPAYVDWLFSLKTLWATTTKGVKNLLKGVSEEEKKADFMIKQYEEMVISNDEIKGMIASFNDEAEFIIESNVSDLANALAKNPDWGYEVSYGDKSKKQVENIVPKIEINWEDLRSDIIQSQAIDLVGIDLSLMVGGFLTTVAVDAVYAYIWASNLGFIGTVAANLGIISAPTVFGVYGGHIGIAIGATLSVAGGWIYINYAEDSVLEKLQHDFGNIKENLVIGDWIYQPIKDLNKIGTTPYQLIQVEDKSVPVRYRWMPGISPVIDVTNATAFNQYIEQVNAWNPNHTPLTPISIKSTKRESIKSMVVQSNINHFKGIFSFSVFDEENRDEFKEAVEFFPFVDFSEVVFYCLEEHWFTSDKSLIVMEDKLLIDWGGWHEQEEVKFSNLVESDLQVKKKTISIGEIVIYKGSESAVKELSTLLKKIIRLREE